MADLQALDKQLERLYRKFACLGANLVVANKNEVLYSKSYGYATLPESVCYAPSGEKTTQETIYRIASISKTVLALGAMILVERELLNLDEDISTYLGFEVRNPNFPNDLITVRQLMTQTSSITDGPPEDDQLDTPEVHGYNGVNGTKVLVTLRNLLIKNNSPYYTDSTYLNRRPGSTFCYSNFGCGILACIIEKITGMFYDDYMQLYLFKPLGIDASFRIDRLKNYSKVATLYQFNPLQGSTDITKCFNVTRSRRDFRERVYPIYSLGENFRGPAGGLFISMPDLTKLMQGLMKKSLPNLKKETIELMFVKNWEGENPSYEAKGLQMRIFHHYYDIVTYGHFGTAYGVKSFMLFSPEKDLGMCFITNGCQYAGRIGRFGVYDLHKEVYCKILETFLEVDLYEETI